MDVSQALSLLKNQFSVLTVILVVLLVGSEILGSHEKIKASSWYGLLKALLTTTVDQIWPKKAPTEEPPQPPAQ